MDSLTQVVVVTSSLALLEEDFEGLSHVNPEVFVEVANESCDSSEDDGLRDSVSSEVLAAERGDLHVVLDHKGAVEALK